MTFDNSRRCNPAEQSLGLDSLINNKCWYVLTAQLGGTGSLGANDPPLASTGQRAFFCDSTWTTRSPPTWRHPFGSIPPHEASRTQITVFRLGLTSKALRAGFSRPIWYHYKGPGRISGVPATVAFTSKVPPAVRFGRVYTALFSSCGSPMTLPGTT